MKSIAFLWDNLGPMNIDRCEAVAAAFAPEVEVYGIEMFDRSVEYAWDATDGASCLRLTLFKRDEKPGLIAKIIALVGAWRRLGSAVWFLCNYDRLEILIFACLLRLCGQRVFVMGCSKFDDLPRKAWREFLKTVFMLPYNGALGSGERSRAYFQFQGFPDRVVVGEYNTLSINRIRSMSGAMPAPDGHPFQQRHFTIIARFVRKKNLAIAIEAYALYCSENDVPRPLHLCGSGVLEAALRDQVERLGLNDLVIFRGFLQTEGIAKELATTLALILPSYEEQFGNVVIEAQAMGLPVLLSDQCGARDHLVRSGVNGFVFEPDNVEGLAWFMSKIARDEALWRRLCGGATQYAPKGDVAQFAHAVRQLIEGQSPR